MLVSMLSPIAKRIVNFGENKDFSEILTGSVWALIGRALATGAGLLATVIIARLYGANIMGIVTVLNSFLMLVTIVTVLGTNTSILRLVPEHLVKYSPTSAFKLYRKIQKMVILVSVLSAALVFMGSDLIADKCFSKPHLSFYFALAAISIVFKSMMLLNTQAVRGLKLTKMFAIMLFLPQAVNVILLLLLGPLFSTTDIPIYALLGSFAITGIVGWAVVEFAFKSKRHPADRVSIAPARRILSISLPMLMTGAMSFFMGQIGVLVLGMYKSDAEVGCYGVAVRLATFTSFMLSAISTVAAPKFSELFHSGDVDKLLYVAKKSAKLIFWTTTPILVVLILVGRPILRTFFGEEFASAYYALTILAVGQFVNSISGSTGFFMNMTSNHSVYQFIMLTATLINIGLTFLLIPSLGMNGAALAAMVSTSWWNIVTLIYIKLKFGKTTGYFPLLAF